VPKRQPIAEDVQLRVVEMYKANAKTAEITRATHVPRASIYWVLERHGIRPNRLGMGRQGDAMTVDEVLDRLRDVERENGELRAKCDRLQATLDTLLDRLGITPAAATRALSPVNETRRGSRA
jgi:hypothetical protein